MEELIRYLKCYWRSYSNVKLKIKLQQKIVPSTRIDHRCHEMIILLKSFDKILGNITKLNYFILLS